MLTNDFNEENTNAAPAWGTREFMDVFGQKYDENYRPREKPSYELVDHCVYDSVSGINFHAFSFNGSRVCVTDPQFVITALDVAILEEDYKFAHVMLDKLLDKDPNDIYALNNKAYLLRLDEQFLSAMDLNNRVLGIDPNNAAAFGCRATSQFLTYNTDKALSDVHRAIECDGQYAPDFILKSHILFKMQRMDESYAALGDALRIKSDNLLLPYQQHSILEQYDCETAEEALEEIKQDKKSATKFKPTLLTFG
jgi:tetratricopeptide (TPR) repeat protein